jgi:hypothetical protein
MYICVWVRKHIHEYVGGRNKIRLMLPCVANVLLVCC